MLLLFGAKLAGLLFVLSAWAKLRNPELFAEIVRGYALPAFLRPAAISRAIPAYECLVGLALLSGYRFATLAGGAGALVFVACTTFLVTLRLARGEKRFRCGCGGNIAQPHSAVWVIARNAGLAILLVSVVVYSAKASMAVDFWPALLTACAVAMAVRLAGAAWTAQEAAREWKALG